MQFHSLKRKTANKKSKPVGRGGTRGKTSGRGTKGQNARAGRKKRPELRDFIKRVPKLRGRGVHGLKSFQKRATGEALKTLLAEKKSRKAQS
jgi:ribosomal protein L15